MIKTTTLTNGLKIATMNVPSITASVGVFIGAGAVNETKDEYGLSHFLEHMAFKGTTTRSIEDIAEHIEFSGGSSNAYTSYSHTAYYANVLVSEINSTVEIILDSVFNSIFPENEIEVERGVIKQEILRGRDKPDSLCFYNLHKAIFGDQPLGGNIIGTSESLDTFDINSFKNYVDKWYQPNNIIIVAAGIIDHDAFVKTVQNLTSHIIRKETPQVAKSSFAGGIQLHQTGFEQVNLSLALESCAAEDIFESQTFEMLSSYLSGGMASPLFKEIREKRGLVYYVDSISNSFNDTGYFNIVAGTTKEHVKEIINISFDEIEKVISNFNSKHIQRAKNQVKVSMGRYQESTGGVMRYIGGNWVNGDQYLMPFEELLNIADSVTEQDLKNAAHKILNSKKAISIVGAIDDETVEFANSLV